MDCTEIKVPDKLVIHFRQNDEAVKSRVFKCFFELFFDAFKRIFRNKCVPDSVLYSIEEQLMTAFVFGLCKFYEDIRRKGWEERGASVKTALFAYCFNQLRALTKFIRTHPGNQYKGDPDVVITAHSESFSVDHSATEEKEFKELFEKAFAKLDDKCRSLIQLRKLDKLKNSEIADRVNNLHDCKIAPGSVNNEVHKCFEKLKKIINDLTGKK